MRAKDLRALQSVVARAGRFGHREHLELAWTYLERYPLAQARDAMAAAIRHIAAEHNAAGKYHETMTLAWTQLVAVHRERWPGGNFEEFLARNPALLQSGLLEGHYSAQMLWSEAARRAWVEPDVRALPQPA